MMIFYGRIWNYNAEVDCLDYVRCAAIFPENKIRQGGKYLHYSTLLIESTL